MIPMTSPFSWPTWPVQKTDRWVLEMAVDDHTLNQVETPMATPVPEAVSLHEQINTAPGTGYTATDLENASFLHTSS